MQKETIVAFILGFVLSGVIFFKENYSLRKMNMKLVTALEQSTLFITALYNYGVELNTKTINKKEGEKQNG